MSALFSSRLLSWYKKNSRKLPWRETKDPYKIWISEVMLQQTTVKAVIPYYQKWIKEFPTVTKVANTSIEKILKQWQGLGYYSRARNLHKAADIICRDFAGQIPDNTHDLKKLPGFGPYTIGAVLSIAFNQRTPIIDANVRRVVMRLLALNGLPDNSHDKVIYEFLDIVMPQKNMSSFNQALMELGALVCRSKEVLCSICPVQSMCKAYSKGLQEIIPQVKVKKIQDVEVVIALIRNKSKFLIQQRPAKGLFADLWEFPGGKIEKEELQLDALKRELREELGIELQSAKFLFPVVQFYTQFRAKLYVWDCELQGVLNLKSHMRWANPKELKNYPMPSGSARILAKLSNSAILAD